MMVLLLLAIGLMIWASLAWRCWGAQLCAQPAGGVAAQEASFGPRALGTGLVASIWYGDFSGRDWRAVTAPHAPMKRRSADSRGMLRAIPAPGDRPGYGMLRAKVAAWGCAVDANGQGWHLSWPVGSAGWLGNRTDGSPPLSARKLVAS